MVAPVPRRKRYDQRWIDMVEDWREMMNAIRAHERVYERPDGEIATDLDAALAVPSMSLTKAILAVLPEDPAAAIDRMEVIAEIGRRQLLTYTPEPGRVSEALSRSPICKCVARTEGWYKEGGATPPPAPQPGADHPPSRIGGRSSRGRPSSDDAGSAPA
jgi:hypothetical protein